MQVAIGEVKTEVLTPDSYVSRKFSEKIKLRHIGQQNSEHYEYYA